jgi:uroporphyrin-III C-methyltransferase
LSVSIVGAGPGDPGLITVRGLELVRHCDVLVYDRLVSPELVDQAPRRATRIARDDLTQRGVEWTLIAHGQAGLRVVRLKGGDPFVFGRGGEEALALATAGVPFEVVPGVSSISAVPAAAGIPVTHRGVSAQVTVASGHDPDALDWPGLARAQGTLVFFMGLANVAQIAAELIAHGRAADTPAAVVSCGTLESQETVTAPLEELAEAAGAVPSPALVIVGEVVRLSEALSSGCRPVERTTRVEAVPALR